MNYEELKELRDEIAANVRELALNNAGDEHERLQALLDVARGGDTSIEVMREAYRLANDLPDEAERMRVLVDLMDGIDATFAAASSETATE